LALVVSFATAASAEVQNVKVSGDLTAYSIWRSNYALDKDSATDTNSQNYFMSIAELQVDADLTDNVSTVVRILNQRDWDDACIGGADSSLDVILDLAYVQMKEMLYSPLTLTIGRQDIWFGQGLVVGAKQRDPDAAIAADEYTAINSFDAVKATLDYDPWTVDLVYSKIEENNIQSATPTGINDDVDLYGANIGYIFDSYNGEAEAYIFSLHDRSEAYHGADANEINTVGLRGSFDPIEDATLAGEAAYQFGNYSPANNISRDRKAVAVDVSGEYRWSQARWTPKLALEYVYFSGEDQDADNDTGDWHAWHPVFSAKSFTSIRQYQNVYYNTAHRTADDIGPWEESPDMDAGMTNQHQILVMGSVYPTENLTLDATYAHFWFDEEPRTSLSDDNIGDEIDLTLTYDYTEDVTFSLLAAWFLPGDYFPGDKDDTAADVVGSMTVSF
jgi:hypothetical protein